MFMLEGSLIGAHVASYIIHCDDVPTGLSVLHTCDNGFCVNPEHLFLGTQQDNMDDKCAKDRQAKGIDNGNAKLTEIQVIEIRAHLDRGDMYQKDIAKKYNVDPTTITNIKLRRQWRHI